ncbi:hypothetical protein SEA_CHEESETOUCH_69 [Gordonia phage CheeseTouch]
MTTVEKLPDQGSWLERYRETLRISVWCGGQIERVRHRLTMRVDGQVAYPGDWIREEGNGFEVIASRAEADL